MRKVIHTSLVATNRWTEIVATCEDGTVWESILNHVNGSTWNEWQQLPAIPYKAAATLVPIELLKVLKSSEEDKNERS